MKRLFLAAFALGLIGCAQQPAPSPGPAVTGAYPYDRWARTPVVWGYRAPVYRDWTTDQLQKRRLDLYAQVPFTRTPNEVPAYIYSGMPLPQQDEIKAIEVELNRRFQAGDKSAELKDFWPNERRHIASGPPVQAIF
jgi:soluble lytic murein transglycosylase-like protein